MNTIADKIRSSMDAFPEVNQRGKIIAVGIALAFARVNAFNAKDDTGVDGYYTQHFYQSDLNALSGLNERLLFDVRTAIRLAKSFYTMLIQQRTSAPATLTAGPSLGGTLLSVHQFTDETTEEIEFINNNINPIIAVHNATITSLQDNLNTEDSLVV